MGARWFAQSPQTLNHLIEFRESARAKIMMRLKLRVHHLVNENADTVRDWLKASTRHRVTSRDAFKYIDHRYRKGDDPQEDWDLILHLWVEDPWVRCVFEEGGVTDGYTDAYFGDIAPSWTHKNPGSSDSVLTAEPLDLVVCSPDWLSRMGASVCI